MGDLTEQPLTQMLTRDPQTIVCPKFTDEQMSTWFD